MSWVSVTTVVWQCDFCRHMVVGEDEQPEGWTHDMTGHDHCSSCTTKGCDCIEGVVCVKEEQP